MTDRLTPSHLRDLAALLCERCPDTAVLLREEAARREVKQPAAPAPADDLVERLRDEKPTFLLNEQAADRIEAQALRIGRLEADAQYDERAYADLQADNARLRDAGSLLYKALVDNDDEGLVEAAEPMRAWRKLTNGGDRG